ncbi:MULTISPECIES: hypothetical protein [Enterobacteriaceae]|uniref:hypothetical protein n=1 Tax=Enterobacteriaceae TaxID=543 RepID=UPI002449B83B|nr:hypothetical protein [Enterobacter roggenkampii]MDG9877881.1 hypothetical protein [Enterobacter roggenkampii]
MQTINNRMTETQIADLFSLAVKLQVKAEESDDRDTAILAYSIQNACSNLTESQREFRAADATIHNLELKLTDMAVQLANAESKCRELAAELSAVDKIHNEAVFITDDHYEQCPAEVQKMIRSLAVLQIPAYDAFLAEVRAQGVEMMAAEADQLMNEFGDDSYKVMVTADLQRFANAFAAQLRKGAAL